MGDPSGQDPDHTARDYEHGAGNGGEDDPSHNRRIAQVIFMDDARFETGENMP
jgi:hypothetical protein